MIDTTHLIAEILRDFNIEFSDEKIWPHTDEQCLEEAIRMCGSVGIKREEFIEEYNNRIGVYKKEVIQTIKKTNFFAGFHIDNAYKNVIYFYTQQPFFYDRNQLYWFWNKKEFKYEMVDETDIIIELGKIFEQEGFVTKTSMRGYLNSIQTYGREHIPKDAPKHWIQFKDKIFDLKTKEIIEASPEWFLCNPIPFSIGDNDSTPTMDKLFSEWVGEEHKQTLYEILAYCCLCDYPIHSLFCFIGSGRNGKSRFLALLNKFIGSSNCISTELDSLTESRFESAKLYRKSVCFMGETNFGVLEKTSIIKKLTGQDLIGGEFKGKNPFDFVNYAKLCISSNSLPSSTDTSDGFYRRWMIVDFPNEFEEGRDILEVIPEKEYNNLANKIIGILPSLMQRGTFTNQGTIEQRKQKYIMASNPLSVFIKSHCSLEVNNYVKYSDFYLAYLKYLNHNKRRKITRKEFSKVLDDEGYLVEKRQIGTENGYWIFGLDLNPNWEEKMTNLTNMTQLTLYTSKIERSENNVISVISVINKDKELQRLIKESARVHLPCRICHLNPHEGNIQDSCGEPICELCFEGIYKGESDYSKMVNKN